MNTAEPLGPSQGFRGKATIYKLVPPYKDPIGGLHYPYIVAVAFDQTNGPHNLVVYPSDGFQVTSPLVLMSGFRSPDGSSHHDIVLSAMGYAIEHEEES